jgi:hypothetical protein
VNLVYRLQLINFACKVAPSVEGGASRVRHMELWTLAARQKRAKDWQETIESEPIPAETATRMKELLQRYRELLVGCWERQQITAQDEGEIRDTERRLQMLHDDSRLVARRAGKGSFNGRMDFS